MNGRDAASIRVLVVDDHELFRDAVCRLLTDEGFDVVGAAANGEEALALVSKSLPDVVLMDLDMPRLGGVQTTKELTRLAPSSRVVVFTASGEEPDVVDAIMAGATGYLLKTAPAEQLVAGIRAAACGESIISPSLATQLLRQVRAGAPVPSTGPSESELTERELAILKLIAGGMDNAEIASTLFLSPKTVKNHITTILRKLQLANRTEAAVYAVRSGLV